MYTIKDCRFYITFDYQKKHFESYYTNKGTGKSIWQPYGGEQGFVQCEPGRDRWIAWSEWRRKDHFILPGCGFDQA